MKLRTDMIKIKKTRKKYVSAIIMCIIGIILTCVFQLNFLNENNVSKSELKSFVGISSGTIKYAPRLPKGFTAVNLENGNYVEIKDPYNKDNYKKWDAYKYARNEKGEIFEWIPAFKYRVEYFKDKEFLGSATPSENYDENDRVISSKDFERKVLNATHFEYKVKDVREEDTKYTLHPAFVKDGYISSGFWVSKKPVDCTAKGTITPDDIYKDIKKDIKSREDNKTIDTRLAGENILNPYEYGAIKILGREDLFERSEYELILGLLNNNISTKEIAKDKFTVKYPLENLDNPKLNFEKAYLNKEYYGDGFTETRGLILNGKNTKALDQNQFLQRGKEYLSIYKNGENAEVRALENNIADGRKINVRTVVNIKPTTIENKVTHKFKANGGMFIAKNGDTGVEFEYTQSLGALINDEKLNKDIPNPVRDGYLFVGWLKDPTGNIYYESQVFEAQWKEAVYEDKEYGLARFYYGMENGAKFIDVKTKIGERISETRIAEITDQINRETGKKIIRWAPDPKKVVMSKGIKGFKPVLGQEEQSVKEIAFTFYKNANMEEWITFIAKYDLKENEKGVAPSSIPGLEEKLKEFAPTDGTNYDYEWNRSIDEERITDTEYIPIFKKPDKPKEGNITVYIDYNGSRYGGGILKAVKFNKGQKISDNKELYEEMLSDRHYKPNYELPKNKEDWYTPNINTVINDTMTFRLKWQITYVTVKFWNAPFEYDKKEIIKEEKIPSGGRVTLPSEDKVLPYYETTNPVTGAKIKRTFNKSDGWYPKEVYGPIYKNSYGIKEEDGKYVLNVYPIFESEYNDPGDSVLIRYDLNIPAGEESNVFYPDREIFREKKMKKGSMIFKPMDSDLPKIPGYTIKGYSPNLPLTVEKDTTIKLLWEKRTLYPVIPPSPSDNETKPNLPDTREPERPYTPYVPDTRGNTRETNREEVPSEWRIDRKEPERPKDRKTEVNVKAGLKSNKYIIFIGTMLTTIIVFSYVKIKGLDELVKRSEKNGNIW